MPGPYAPTASLGADPALPDGPASNAAVFRELLNARSLFRSATSGEIAWSGDFGVEAGGSNSSFTLTIGAVRSLVLPAADGSSDDLWSYAGGTIGASKIEGGGNLSNSTWYYVYAKPGSGGACDFEISTSAPRAHRVFKSPVTTATYSRRYLGCFVTTGAGAPVPMRATGGRCVYLEPAIAAGADSDSGSSYRNVSLATRVPPHARLAQVAVTLTGAGPSTFRAIGGVGGTNTNVAFRPMVLDASQRLEWSANGAAGSISVDVFGFEE